MKNVLRTLVSEGQVSLTLADTTEIVREGIKLHKLSPASAIVFGKAISAMTFMSACLKEETGEISLSVQSDGTGGGMGVSGNRKLYMRGYIERPQAEGDEGETFGKNGVLTIIRDDGYNRPFVGTCAFPESAGVDKAFEEYYRVSEQLPTCIQTAVELDGKGDCTFAGIAVLQPLPFADENAFQKMRETPLKEVLKTLRDKTIETCVNVYFSPDKSVWEERTAIYRCHCSREYLKRVLVTLGKKQTEEIIRADGAVRVHCHYCNTDYEFTEEDAKELFPDA